MSDLIFGYTWAEIDAAQRGGKLSLTIVRHSPNPTAKPEDVALFESHGLKELESMGLFGVIDRLKTSGIIQ